MIIQYLQHMTYSWGNLVPILTAEMAISIEIPYLFSKRLPAERLYADRNSWLLRPFKFHTFPAFRDFPPSFKVKSGSDFFSPTSCPPSPCLGLWPSHPKWCIFSWYKAIKSPENQSRHRAVHVTNFTAHSYNSQSRQKLEAGEGWIRLRWNHWAAYKAHCDVDWMMAPRGEAWDGKRGDRSITW